MKSNFDEYNSFYELPKIHQSPAWGEVKGHKKIAWKIQVMKCFWNLEYFISNPDVIHSCSNSQTWWTWAEQPEIHARTMKIRRKLEKNQLEFIWKDFTYRSQWNNSHLIQMSISWDSIENKFFTITMKKLSHEVRWMKKLEVRWNNAFMC